MGKSITPPYVIDVHTRKPDGHTQIDTMTWDAKTYGRANAMNLEKWAIAYGRSFNPDGVNFHISKAVGYLPYPNRVILRKNVRTDIIAVWTAPPFFVW